MRRRLRTWPRWRGRLLYLPPLTNEWRRARIASAATSALAIFWWACFARDVPGAILVAPIVLFLGPVFYFRSWRIWDVLVWDSESSWKTPPAEQDANYEAASDAVLALANRRPDAVRAALTKVVNPTAWRRMVDLYYLGLADMMDGRAPAPEVLAAAMEHVDAGPRYESARVMVALIEAGSAHLSGSDWRTPLLECRKQLGLRLSVRRVVWPLQFGFVVMTVTYLLVLAYVTLLG
jgi:hypothetical protein